MKKLIEWINKENNIVSICIIDKLTLSRINIGEIKLIKKEENKPNYWETLIYTLQQFNYLTNTYKRDITPLWEPYIEDLIYSERYTQKARLAITSSLTQWLMWLIKSFGFHS